MASGTTSFLRETLVPFLSNIVDLGASFLRFRKIWTSDFDADGTVTITRTPTATTDAANKKYVDDTVVGLTVQEVDLAPSLAATTILQVDQADGFVLSNPVGTTARLDLAAVPTSVLAGPITAAKGGTNIDTSASTGVPVIDAGVWTVDAALDVAKGGTNLASGTSGGVLGYTAAGTLASSVALAASGVVLGGGAGATPTATVAGAAGTTLHVAAGGGAPVFDAAQMKQSFRELHLRTHPDNDLDDNQVALIHLGGVVMDDGYYYNAPITNGTDAPLTANITVSGAAGLDTGARVASTGYETYIIGKSSTKATADLRLLLHRAKDYSADQNFTTDTSIAQLLASANIARIAQSFQVTTAGKLEMVDVRILRNGVPTAGSSFWFEVQADAAGNPSGTALATSDKLGTAALSLTTARWIRVPFRSPASLSVATTYWLVMRADYVNGSGAINIEWRGAAAGGYANGQSKRFDGAAWQTTDTGPGFYTVAGGDQDFKLYITRNDAAVTMPTGYDQQCLLAPWVFNNSGNTFNPVVYHNREAQPLSNLLLAAAIGSPVLIDMSIVIPPRQVKFWGFILALAAAANSQVGGVPDGMTVSNTFVTADLRRGGQITFGSTAGGAKDVFDSVLTEFQGVYSGGETNVHDLYLSQWEW